MTIPPQAEVEIGLSVSLLWHDANDILDLSKNRATAMKGSVDDLKQARLLLDRAIATLENTHEKRNTE